MTARASHRSVWLKSFLASFAVYLLPIVGPHAAWLLGERLVHAFAHGDPHQAAAWKALEAGAALALQLAAWPLFAWFFRRPRWWRLLPLAAAVPVAFVTVQWLYLVAIPSRFLIEADVTPERTAWKEVCSVPDATLSPVRSPPDLPLERVGEAWLLLSNGLDSALLTMPGCRVLPMDLSVDGRPATEPFVVPGGRCVFNIWDNHSGQSRWWVCTGIGHAPELLSRPPADPNRCAPILSADGNWVAWIEYVPGAVITPLPQRIVIRSLRDSQEVIVPLPPPGGANVLLAGVDLESQEITLYEHAYATRENRLTVIGLDGARRGDPLVANGVDPQATTFLRVGRGWVAWDAYRESEPYRVAWSLPTGRGSYRVPKGRGITAVAASPDGAYVAVSTTTSLNIGRIRDTVCVIRTRDGAELFRRYLPTYAHSAVTFLGDRLFAYADWNGTRATVRVLQIPG